MKEKVTLQELANYAEACSYQGYCVGSVAPGGDWDEEAIKWQKHQEAAEIIIADFFCDGDIGAALKYINNNAEHAEFRTFIYYPDTEEDGEFLDPDADCERARREQHGEYQKH